MTYYSNSVARRRKMDRPFLSQNQPKIDGFNIDANFANIMHFIISQVFLQGLLLDYIMSYMSLQ